MLKKIGIAASAGVIGLSMLAGAATMVNAQSSDTADGINFFERLANKLGISEETLTQAGKDVQYEIIDEKVAKGEIDSEKAEKIKEKIASEEGFGMFGGPGMGRLHMMKLGNPEMLADFLGITQEEAEALKEEGLNFQEILEKYGKTKEEFHSYMEENMPLPPFLADFLGISDEEVSNLEDQGLKMDDVLKKYGKTEDDLHTYMEENRPEKEERFMMRFGFSEPPINEDAFIN